jgi:hypothetical protein
MMLLCMGAKELGYITVFGLDHFSRFSNAGKVVDAKTEVEV